VSRAYAFGDTPTASARLDVLASVFAPPSRALLSEVARARGGRRGARPPELVLDLGCGPGHTTALLAGVFEPARVVGIDSSAAFVAEAAARSPDRCAFVVGDASRPPLPCVPADVVYARFLLVHLPDPRAVVIRWAGELRPGGVVVVEEPEDIETGDEAFCRYLELASVVVADRGGDLYAGRQLADLTRLGGLALPPGTVRGRRATLDVATGSAASIFALNLSTWGDDPALSGVVEPGEVRSLLGHLEARRADDSLGVIRWHMRQLVVGRAVNG
jgi:hypothetical protein